MTPAVAKTRHKYCPGARAVMCSSFVRVLSGVSGVSGRSHSLCCIVVSSHTLLGNQYCSLITNPIQVPCYCLVVLQNKLSHGSRMADGARLPLNSVCFVYYAIQPPRARAIESNRVCWILCIVAMLELNLRHWIWKAVP